VDIALQLFSRIPEGWPRIVLLLVVAAIYTFPMLRGQISRRERQRPELEHLRLILEVKKLSAEIEVLGQGRDLGDLSGADEARRLRTLLRGRQPTAQADERALDFRARAQAALAGSLVVAMLATLVALSGGFRPPSLPVFAVRQLLGVVLGTVLVGLIPTRTRTLSFVYGFLLPFAVAMVVLVSRSTAPEHPG
jgi:hypothetical protein